jgi:hypothetical protein
MARKNGLLSGNNRLFLLGGVGATSAVLIAVFVFGVGLDFVKPLFQEPKDLTVQDLQNNEQVTFTIGGNIEKILCGDDPIPQGTFNDPCIPPIMDDGEPILPPETIDDIDDVDEGIVEPPPPTNQTEFSEDPPIEQICDTDPSNIICQVIGPPSSTIVLTSKVEKISSSGISEFVKGEFGLAQLSFFVEESTNIDYATGRLIFELGTKSDRANHEYSSRSTDGTQAGLVGCTNPTFQECVGKFDILIGDQSIFPKPIELGILRTGDAQGTNQLIFLSGQGSTAETGSRTFTFSFADHFSKFGNEEITRIKGVVTELNIAEALSAPEQLPSDVTQFTTTDQQVFAMEIARDDQQIIITDENTNATSRVYPTDSRIVLTTISKTIRGSSCEIGRIPADGSGLIGGDTVSYFLQNGCLPNSITGTTEPFPNNIVVGTAPPPSVTGIILLDSDGNLITNKPGGSGKIFDELVTRNQNYTLLISSPNLTGELSFGKSQETKSYTFSSKGSVSYTISVAISGNTSRCGESPFCTYHYMIYPTGFSPGATESNFP